MSEERQSAPDPLLLRWQEDELYEAEKKVLHAFREGWKEDGWKGEVVVPPEGSSAPEKPAEGHTAEDWQGAILRAGFLRDLFLGNYGRFDPRYLVISRAWVEGRLTLDYCESQFPLLFSQCIFSEGISLWNATLPRLILKGCEVRLFQTEDPQMVECALFAQGSKVISDVFLIDGFQANGVVYLHSAEIGGQLACRGGHFEKGLRAQRLKASSSVFLIDGFQANGEVYLNGAEIGGQFACSGGHFENGLSALNLKASSDVFLSAEFQANGVVYLHSAEIGGQLNCIFGHFNGEVDLNGAEIGGQLGCIGGRFKKGLRAQNLKASSDVLLSHGFKANGEVDLNGAEIGGKLTLSGAEIKCSAEGFRYQHIDIGGGDWKQGLKWLENMEDAKFQPYEQLMAAYRRMGHANWARNIGHALEKKRSREFQGWQRLPWRMWYGILRWTIGYGYRPFASFLWAAGLLMAGSLLFSSGHEGVISKFLPSEQALVNEWLPNEWIPSDGEALASPNWQENREPSPDYLPFNPVIYSLESTFPVLNLGQLEKWHPSNGFLLGVRWAWTLIGTLLLAILALFGAGVLGPRTQSGDDGG